MRFELTHPLKETGPEPVAFDQTLPPPLLFSYSPSILIKLMQRYGDMMLIGMVGAPNKGKSTIFSAITESEVDIADYPFTTIKPNLGVAYATSECPDKSLGIKCHPRNSACIDGTRLIPLNVIDVAGLVPGASLGKGMGSQFLNDLVNSEALIQVVDVSGETGVDGNPCSGCDPSEEVKMVYDELVQWLSNIIKKHLSSLSRRKDGSAALAEMLSGFGANSEKIQEIADSCGLPLSNIAWDEEAVTTFAEKFIISNKPFLVAANKLDKSNAGKLEALISKLPGHVVVGCSGAIELALKKASKNGLISYSTWKKTFEIIGKPSIEQNKALSYMMNYVKEHNGTGIQEIINKCVFGLLDNIVVYPVENENKYTDHFDNVLPDAILLKKGSTALDLAASIHTDLSKHMLYAIDARTKNRLSKEYVLQNNDIIKIVSTR